MKSVTISILYDDDPGEDVGAALYTLARELESFDGVEWARVTNIVTHE
jgi:hypothetical protein